MNPILLVAKAPSASFLSSFAVTTAQRETHKPLGLNLTNVTSRSCVSSAKAHSVKISEDIFSKIL